MAHHGPVCAFRIFWLQIAITPCAFFHHNVFFIICVSLWCFTQATEPICWQNIYSWLVISTSLISNNCLSRSKNLVSVLTWKSNNRLQYCGKEEKLLLRSNFSSFPQYFQYIFNFCSQTTYSFVKCACSIYCFLQFQKSGMTRCSYLEVFQTVPWISR